MRITINPKWGMWLSIVLAIIGAFAGAGTGTTGTSCAAQTNGIIHTGGLTIPGNSTTCGAGQTATQGQILN